MLGNFKYKSIVNASNLESIEDRGYLAFELNIYDGTNDLEIRE